MGGKQREMEPSKTRSSETRRANVIYFLNRNGCIEHPHLIRVHHFCQSGVHLRDVKRWMAELRGKEMPDSFSWSYQRRYKNRILWQDLTDDDLITPVSDYEYVLLGSLHAAGDSSSPAAAVIAAAAATVQAESKPDLLHSTDYTQSTTEMVKASDEELGADNGAQPLGKEAFQKEKVEGGMKSPSGNAGGRSCSWRASHLFCTLITCRVTETEDYAILNTPRRVIDTPRRVISAAGGSRSRRRRRERSSNLASPRNNKFSGAHLPPLNLQSPNERNS